MLRDIRCIFEVNSEEQNYKLRFRAEKQNQPSIGFNFFRLVSVLFYIQVYLIFEVTCIPLCQSSLLYSTTQYLLEQTFSLKITK